MSIITLAAVMIILFLTRKKIQRPLSRLAAFSFALIIAGIAFGEDRLTSCSLMGSGIFLAVIDMLRKLKTNVKSN